MESMQVILIRWVLL